MCAQFCAVHESFSFERPPIVKVKKYFQWLYSWLYILICYLCPVIFCRRQLTQSSLNLYSD